MLTTYIGKHCLYTLFNWQIVSATFFVGDITKPELWTGLQAGPWTPKSAHQHLHKEGQEMSGTLKMAGYFSFSL